MNPPTPKSTLPPFRPTVAGCVGKDPRLSAMLKECCASALYAFSAHTYRSLLCETSSPAHAELFEALAAESAEQLRAFARLNLAVGGAPSLHCQLRVHPRPVPPKEQGEHGHAALPLCREAIGDTKALIDICQTVMGRTQDRVVRSFLAAVLSELQRQVERLAHAANE